MPESRSNHAFLIIASRNKGNNDDKQFHGARHIVVGAKLGGRGLLFPHPALLLHFESLHTHDILKIKHRLARTPKEV
jgi:hypothetical protein